MRKSLWNWEHTQELTQQLQDWDGGWVDLDQAWQPWMDCNHLVSSPLQRHPGENSWNDQISNSINCKEMDKQKQLFKRSHIGEIMPPEFSTLVQWKGSLSLMFLAQIVQRKLMQCTHVRNQGSSTHQSVLICSVDYLKDNAIKSHGIAGFFNSPHLHKCKLLFLIDVNIHNSITCTTKQVV